MNCSTMDGENEAATRSGFENLRKLEAGTLSARYCHTQFFLSPGRTCAQSTCITAYEYIGRTCSRSAAVDTN